MLYQWGRGRAIRCAVQIRSFVPLPGFSVPFSRSTLNWAGDNLTFHSSSLRVTFFEEAMEENNLRVILLRASIQLSLRTQMSEREASGVWCGKDGPKGGPSFCVPIPYHACYCQSVRKFESNPCWKVSFSNPSEVAEKNLKNTQGNFRLELAWAGVSCNGDVPSHS